MNLDIKNIEGKMDNLKKSSGSLDEKLANPGKDAENNPNASECIEEEKWRANNGKI